MQRTAAIMPTKKTPASRPATQLHAAGGETALKVGGREGGEGACKNYQELFIASFPLLFYRFFYARRIGPGEQSASSHLRS